MSKHSPDPAQDPFAGSDAAERRWLERTRGQLEAATLPFDEAANWRRLVERVEAEAQRPRAGWIRPARKRLPWWQAFVSFALGAATAAVVAVSVLPLVTQRGAEVEPLGAATPGVAEGMTVLQVVFRDEAMSAQIRAALEQVGGEVVGGPGRLGVWRVAVPAGQSAAAKQTLRANAIVESVSQ
ncbi:hypothetical protein [Caldimonas sp.]|uniref:hypothetical protein n=1 Tax=Caldimonas sp. TaxID=2838790 RepID=UPI003918853B